LVVEEIEYIEPSPYLSFTMYGTDAILTFTPPTPYTDGQTVEFQLTEAEDVLGHPLQEPLYGYFTVDFCASSYGGWFEKN